jgi:hypothetical protein
VGSNLGNLGDSGLVVPASEDPDHVLGYIREGVQEGDNFLRRQKGYLKIDVAQKMVMGDFPDDIRSSDLSHITDNEYGSIALNLQAQNTDTRPFFIYTTKNPSYDAQVQMLNVCAEYWWLARQIDMRFRDAINGCSAGGSACFWTTWNPDTDDFESRYIDARDALPVRPSSYHSYQDCEMLVIRQERSTSELKRRWPSFADRIRSDRDGAAAISEEADTYSSRVIGGMGKSPFTLYREFITKAKATMAGGSFPVTDLFTCYLHDYSRNTSKDRVKLMGPWSSDGKRALRNWSYDVLPGDLIYPGGRVIVATNQCVMYDGPNTYWHDQFPASKLTLVQWPYPDCYLGKALLWDIIEEQKELNESRRIIGDHMRKMVDPDLVIDQNSGLSRASAEKIRARKAGGKFFKRPGPGDGFRFEYPPQLPPEAIEYPDKIIARMRSKAQIFDMQTVLNKGQLPGNNTLDAILSMQTGGIRAISRTLEAFMREVGSQMGFNFIQRYTKVRRMRIYGPRGVTPQDFDVDPNVLVPAFVGDDFDAHGNVRPERLERPRSRRTRARDYMGSVAFDIRPNSMLRQAHIDEEVRDMALQAAGVIDPITLLEHMDYPNVGADKIPGGDPGTVFGRLMQLGQLNMLGQVSAQGRKAAHDTSPSLKGNGVITSSNQS